MNRNKTTNFYKIPVIGYVVHMLISVVRLPVINSSLIRDINKNRDIIESQKKEIAQLSSDFTKSSNDIKSIFGKLNNLETTQIQKSSGEKKASDSKYLADNHLLDGFYLNFENKFRGSEDEISERLVKYLPRFKKISKISNSKPVLDIGCGRGEMLELLKKNKINALGIDTNQSMIKLCNDKGLEAQQGDAMDYLSSVQAGSLSAIAGFHIIEHINFVDLLKLFTLCYRAVDDDGFILFETPNPANLNVGANTIYYDPSHLRPLPSELISFTLENIGFRSVETLYLHPETDNTTKEASRRLFGPRDYAVIAKK